MQTAIGKLSELSLSILSFDIPYVVIVGITILTALILTYRKEINIVRLKVLAIIVFLLILGQNSTDFYFNHKFYELQHNWHYVAYGLFSYFGYQFFYQKGLPLNKIILYTFLFAGSISIFDEAVQVPLSSRIFDICDIAKDLWGTIIGLIFIIFIINSEENKTLNKKIRQANISSYLKDSYAILFLLGVFTYILLFTGSLITEIRYLLNAIIISLVIFFITFMIIHLSQFRIPKIILIVLGSVLLIGILISGIQHKDNKVTVLENEIILYYGIPIPYFDVMIHNNGFPRLVDKKTFFNSRDRQTILSYSEDILLIGTEGEISNIHGFPENINAQFIYNYKNNRGLQVIILNTKEASEKYNKLKQKGLNVLFIIHQE